MDGRRSDWPLIKHLSKTYSPKVGFYYQRVPFLDLVEVQDAIEAITASSTSVDIFNHLIFDDFTVRMSSPDNHVDVFMRFTTHDTWLETSKQKPWIVSAYHREGTDFIAGMEVEYWINPKSGWSPLPLTISLLKPNAATGGEIGVQIHDGKGWYVGADAAGDSFDGVTDIAVTVLSYLGTCPEYVVEVNQDGAERERRSLHPKPWTLTNLPCYILLDPTKAPSGERTEDMGGTHASPRPHQRRGHWATLRAEKFKRNDDGSVKRIFRKPAWVGPREWIMEGNRYRVVSTEGTS